MKSPNKRTSIGLLSRIYSVVTSSLVPVIGGVLALFPRGRRRFDERFGVWGDVPPIAWWFHGASVGEVQGLLPLIELARSDAPGDRFLLTATSPTGLERGASSVDVTRLLPLDAPYLVRRALDGVAFDRFVLSETEIWPVLLREVLSRGAPCHIINGRVSDYTLSWYRAARSVIAPLLSGFTSVSVPDETQRNRFIELGVSLDRIYVTGHTKYDRSPRFQGVDSRLAARRRFFGSVDGATPIVVLGSVRPGEEKFWFEPLRRIWESGRSCKVIVAPRHAERFDYFWEAIGSLRVPSARLSDGALPEFRSCDVLLLDTLGDLEEAYAASDLAFVGATLVNIGGHNPFEPAMYGVPIIVGPHVSVIRELVMELSANDGVITVQTEAEIETILNQLCGGSGALRGVGLRGRDVWQVHQGASRRVMDVIMTSEEYSCQ
jgi:3-deoxy-D-manno-octulosonic-acid transferase